MTEGHRDAEIPFGNGVTHVEDYEILAYRASSLFLHSVDLADG